MIKDALLRQRREVEQCLAERYIDRETTLPTAGKLVRVITGPRRAGKSFFAIHSLASEGPFGYVNFDDEHLAHVSDFDEVTAVIDTVYGKPKQVLLDEIQNLPQWELLVNRLQRQGRQLTVTGSNAHLLSSELATHLTGRHVSVTVLPFSFSEYLSSLGGEPTAAETREAAAAYAETGGFPEPILHEMDGRQYLRTLVDSILLKDIVRRHKIRAVQGIRNLAGYLFSNMASGYSYKALTEVTGCRSAHTVQKYLTCLEEAFLFFSLGRYSFKSKERARSERNIYCVDNGLACALAPRFSPDFGKLYENLAAVELKKRELRGEADVFYWRNDRGEEVDFVVKKGLKVAQLIQVCFDPSEPKTKRREVRALLKAAKELRCDELLVLTDNLEDEQDAQWHGAKGRIRFHPLWKWLTNP